MRASFALLLILWLFPAIANAVEPGDNRQWKKVTDKNGIQVYQSHSDDSRFKTFRGVAFIEHTDANIVEAMVEDTDGMAYWLHLISKVSLIEKRNFQDRTLYVETRLPWPVKDRDTYIDVNIEQRDDLSIMIWINETEDAPPPGEGYLRIPELEGYILIEPIADSLEVKMTFEVILDPGVYFVPSWFVNMILSDVPYFTLKKLRKVVKMEKYQGYDAEYIRRRPWVWGDEAQQD